MDNDQQIRYFEHAVLYTTGYIMSTVLTNNGRMEFQVFGREILDIMTSLMLIVTFLIPFVEFCLALRLSGKHRHYTAIDASVGDNIVSHIVGLNFFVLLFFSPGMTFLQSVRAYQFVEEISELQ